MISKPILRIHKVFGASPMLVLALALAMAACGGGAQDYTFTSEVEPRESQHGGHAHTPLFGGQLVEIGDHYANIEFLFDADTGTVTVYTLDAHADYVQRVAHPYLDLLITPEGVESPILVQLHAVEDPLSGETVGDASKFEGTAPELVGLTAFHAVISQLTIRGGEFENIAFEYPTSYH